MYCLDSILRENIKRLKPYSSARDDFSGEASIWIDANENPFDTGVNRYPDPHQKELKARLATVKEVSVNSLFIGNGSDEIVDLLYRIVCQPSIDNVIVMPPTYGMYAVAAEINDVEVRKVYLKENFSIDEERLMASVDANTKLIFICTPNNPTGSVIPLEVVERIATNFKGILVVDEAYIDFTSEPSAATLVSRFPNIFVLQTMSKAWGLAGVRVGVGIASEELVKVLDKVKAPYNVSNLSQLKAIEALSSNQSFTQKLETILEQREVLAQELAELDVVEKVYPSAANFLLVRFKDTARVFSYLMQNGIVARDRSKEMWCDGCVRLTVGTPDENKQVVNVLTRYISTL